MKNVFAATKGKSYHTWSQVQLVRSYLGLFLSLLVLVAQVTHLILPCTHWCSSSRSLTFSASVLGSRGESGVRVLGLIPPISGVAIFDVPMSESTRTREKRLREYVCECKPYRQTKQLVRTGMSSNYCVTFNLHPYPLHQPPPTAPLTQYPWQHAKQMLRFSPLSLPLPVPLPCTWPLPPIKLRKEESRVARVEID